MSHLFMEVVLPRFSLSIHPFFFFLNFIIQEQSVDDQLPLTPSAFPSISSTTKKVEDQGSSIDILERPSPVSVLEPLFAEEDISPASIRTRSGMIYI